MRAYAALALGVFFISWSAIFIRWAPMPGSASAQYRVLFAAIVLLPVLIRGRAAFTRRIVWLASLGGIFFAADLSMYSTAVLQSSAANATVLGNNTPIFVGLLTWFYFKRRPRQAFWLGLAVAISGSVVIVSADVLHRAHFGPADFLAIAASACFAVYLLVTERMREHLDTGMLLALSLVGTSLALVVFNTMAGISLHVPDARAWLSLVGLVVICQLLGYFLLTYTLGHLSAAVTSVTLLAQAPLTALLALMFLGERISPSQVAGGALVLFGVWIVNRYGR